MLRELHVRDLGVIRDLTIDLGAGMTALTGETGAGKTLLVAALQLVLGARASTGLVRAGAVHALVDARFEDAPTAAVALAPGRLDTDHDHQADDDADPRETILSRAVPASGRSRAWVDGRMAPVTVLSEIASGLVDIHGQHDQQTLLTVSGQRAALDQFAHADLAPLHMARRRLGDVHRSLAALGGSARERAQRLDLLRYQEAEIRAAAIDDVDEEAALDAEAQRLSDMSALRAAASNAASSLDADDGAGGGVGAASATGHAGEAVRALGGLGPLAEWEQRLRGALADLADIAAELHHVADTWEDDPARLEA
ncbi:MAG: AAA family ATPase, partial [Acidimicrobiales bacterium]